MAVKKRNERRRKERGKVEEIRWGKKNKRRRKNERR